MTLLQEINDLKKEVHNYKHKLRQLGMSETGNFNSTARSKMDMSVRSKEPQSDL